MSSQAQIPSTPRIISATPTPSEHGSKDGYFPPTTRAMAATGRVGSVEPISETENDEEDPELARARSRSRSPQLERRSTGRPVMNGSVTTGSKAGDAAMRRKKAEEMNRVPDGQSNGFLSPNSAYPRGFGSAYWRNLSRSPSPLGLIPIHRDWIRFIHKHEVPRKFLHVSIGFITILLYFRGWQADQIHPTLLYLLIPIFSVDFIRFRWDRFNRFYIWCLGGFMREKEAHDQYNGVISYLAGLWVALRFCRKDVGAMSVLLLSWCDTAASTFGRLWGKYTPRVRRGKSLAGTLAAFTVGVATSALFWGLIAPLSDPELNTGANRFAFQGLLTLPTPTREWLGLDLKQATIDGPLAITVMSIASGFVASVSEAIDVFHLDDNLTIPVFCGIGLGAFLWAFGAS